jgi:two-component system copper resistance phosphate regulon response regulator CusR
VLADVEDASIQGEFHPEAGSRVLVVEDDKPLAELLRQQLETKSYLVNVVHDGEAARDAICGGGFDLVVLDLNLPKLDGVSVLQQVRPSVPRLPVLVLTARNRVEDKALALDTGADDCMVKPFSFMELHARVRALLRRSSGPVGKISQVADLVLNRELRKVERNGRRIDLTTREYDLLDYLMRNAGRPVSRNRLMEEVWKMPFDPSTNVVDVYQYNGNSNVNSVSIGDGYQIPINVPGNQLFQQPGNDLLGSLQQLVAALQGGNTSAIGNTTNQLRQALDYLIQQRAFYGNVTGQINSQEAFLKNETVNIQSEEDSLVGIDTATAITNLSQAQTASEATLAAAGRVLQQTLLDYLR